MQHFLPLHIKPVHTLVFGLLLAFAIWYGCSHASAGSRDAAGNAGASGVAGGLFNPLSCM